MPRLKKDDQERLAALANSMLSQAQSFESPRLLSARGFSRASISILHQQMRCANLAWALKFSGRLKPGDVIGIIGGSFSGLMLATALAMCSNVIVYIFDRERRLMQRFLNKGHRFISPNLNSRSLQKAFHPTLGMAFYDPPIFKWEADSASTVAIGWRNEFLGYAETLPIFCLLNREVKPHHLKLGARSVAIQFDPLENGLTSTPIKLNWLIDATGFGPERNPLDIMDCSYWETGHKLIYEYLRAGARVLVSGCGDSGIIEMMHYAIKDFSHDRVSDFWPPASAARYLDYVVDQKLESASFSDITDWEDDWDLDDLPFNSEIRWFRGVCRYGAEGYHGGPNDLDAARRRIFDAIEVPVLNASSHRHVRKGDWKGYFDLIPDLKDEDQARVRAAITPVLDELSSVAIHDVMQQIDLSVIFDMQKLHAMKSSTQVVLNGLAPTPFTRQLSPFNVWLLHVMMSFPNVTFRSGKVAKLQRTNDGRFEVRLEDGAVEIFDRVVTRYGTDATMSLSHPRSTTEPVDHLLASPMSKVRERNTYRYVDLAKREIDAARARLARQRVQHATEVLIDKSVYADLLEVPRQMRRNLGPGKQYSQATLVQKIKQGIHPKFCRLRPW